MKPFVYIIIAIFILGISVFAQDKSSQTGTVTQKTALQACDGALDIVPSKSMTFMRKRYRSSNKPSKSKVVQRRKPNS